MRQANKKKCRRRLRAFRRLYKKGGIDSVQVGKSLASYRGHLMHGHTYHLRQRIWSDFVLTRDGNIQNPENESVQPEERTGAFELEKRGE